MSAPTSLFTCTEDQEAQVQELVGDESTTSYICSTFDCSITAVSCVLRYMAREQEALGASQAETAKAEVAQSLDVMFVLFSAFLVFGPMQLGFALVCAGAVRSKNCMNVLMKNLLDAFTSAIGFYLFGYAFAFGHQRNVTSNRFIGDWNFALSYTTDVSGGEVGVEFDGFAAQGWHAWLFHWTLAATAATIAAGALAERCTFGAYLAYSFFLSAFVYPVVSHWVWSPDGWLSAFNTSDGGRALILETGAIDFAGGGVVHLTGGVAALVGAAIIGPRIGRFDASGKVNEMRGHSATLVVMGTFLLWFGFYGFNPGANDAISTEAAARVVSRVTVTTTLSAAASGIVSLLLRYATSSAWDVLLACNGCLAGLVAITAGCAVVEPWAALICGAVAALVFMGAEHVVLYKMKIDDPVSAVALHLGCGLWSLLFPGLLAKPGYVREVYGEYGFGPNVRSTKKYGILYGGHGQVLLCQVIEALAVTGWVGFMLGCLFGGLRAAGRLRVSVEAELAGLDVAKQGPGRNGVTPAYGAGPDNGPPYYGGANDSGGVGDD